MDIKELNKILESFLNEGEVVSFTDFKRQKEAQKNLDDAFQIKINKITVKWCETAFGNRFFKDNEQMSYEEFQKRAYVVDYFLQQQKGMCKVAYIADIDLTEHEETNKDTYEGKLYLGEGKDGVDLLFNMEEFITESTGKHVFFDNIPVTINDRELESLSKEFKTPEQKSVMTEPSQNNIIKDYSNNGNKKAQDAEVGDIIYTSFGYNMTIVDFFRVVERKKASIKLEALASKHIQSEYGSSKVIPTDKVISNSDVDGKLFRLAKNYGVCTINGHTARYWDGKPKYYSDMD